MELYDVEQSAVEELFLELWQPLFVYARSALKNDDAAAEAVQETFRFASARPGALLTSPDPRTWLLLTLKYIIQNLRRNRAELSRLLLADYGYAQDEPRAGAAASAQEFLGEADFELLARFVSAGWPLKSAAEERNISLLECQVRFRRAKKRLLARTDPGKYLKS